MLQEPMREKLQALKLEGMIEALKRQEQDEGVGELSFLDRLALLVDQQWTWRQNQVLARRLRASRLKGNPCVENIDYRAERGLNRTVIRALTQESSWVKNHEHIFVLGPTGVGKSYVASAMAQKACRDGYSVSYTRGACPIPGSASGTGGRKLEKTVSTVEPHRRAGGGRLGHDTDVGSRAPRLLGDRGGPLPDTLDDPDFATAGVPLA
jgi:hypothetical protein